MKRIVIRFDLNIQSLLSVSFFSILWTWVEKKRWRKLDDWQFIIVYWSCSQQSMQAFYIGGFVNVALLFVCGSQLFSDCGTLLIVLSVCI